MPHLRTDGWLLTQNLRQSRILRRLHDRAQLVAGHEVWASARLLPFDAWLESQWRDGAATRPELPALLHPAAAEWLWRQRAARDVPGLIDPAELAARARASWLRLRSYGGDIADIERWPQTRDQQAFLAWAQAVEAELADRNVRDPSDLARVMVETRALPAPGPPLLLTGFRRLAPAQLTLIAALRERGWSVEIDQPAAPVAGTWQYGAADPEAEQGAALAWIRTRLDLKPDGIHGLIVPDLAARRGAIERALAAALQPELELPGGAAVERVFDLAGGHPLHGQPIVEMALALLEFVREPISWVTVSRLLRSPHIAGAQAERNARIRLDLELRSVNPSLHLTSSELGARAVRAGAEEFAAAVVAAVESLRGRVRRRVGGWAETFAACLAAWGWPGGLGLDSHEFQAARAFGEKLRELARLDAVVPELTVHEAVRELRRFASAPFQPERGEPALFVFDSVDDPGIRFDSLWVAGLTAATWPRPATVDPLLPIEVQRKFGMPGVTAEGCVIEARAVMGGWQSQSRELVLSWPRLENDTEVDRSPLIPPAARPLPQQPAYRGRDRLAFEAAALEPLAVDPAPARKPGAVRGGARLLELQSHCPFRAFAELRLDARPLEEPQPGVDRRNRGTILHRALQGFWSETRSLARLAALAPEARRDRVVVQVDAALRALLQTGTSERSRLLERDWHCRAIGNLLEIELARPDFVVLEAERSMQCELGGLVLRLQVDRVDRIGDKLLVIDYKTGKASPSQWRGARMDSPQLPLYAVLHAGQPSGIAVATVTAAGARFRGIAGEAGLIDGLQPAGQFRLTEDHQVGFEWPAIIRRWHAWLEQLARDHAAGHAEVDPKLAGDTCRNCHLGALCRVEAVAPDEPEVEEGESDE
ncbi:MAG: PD-(D/E)XK nuclease family protein [Steroidobacteraceae bacterium]